MSPMDGMPLRDPVLAYIAAWMNSCTKEILIKTVTNFFPAEAISKAKMKLWDAHESLIGEKIKRRIGSIANSKQNMEATDIYDALEKMSQVNGLPMIVVSSEDLMTMPARPEENATASVAGRLLKIEKALGLLQEDNSEFRRCMHRVDVLEETLIHGSFDSYAMPEHNQTQSKSYADVTASSGPVQMRKQKKSGIQNAPHRNAQTHPDVTRPSNTGFTVVERKKNKKRAVSKSGTGGEKRMKAAPVPKRDIFVYRLAKEVKEEDIVADLKEALPSVAVDVKKVSHEDAKFSSFRVICNADCLEQLMDDSVWPNGCRYRRFYQRNGGSKTETASSNL